MTTIEDRPVVSGDGVDVRPYLVIGGGPAGLTAGYLLAKAGKKVIVFEADAQVGGLAKTIVDPDGYRFDLGGHRFFTKNQEVNDLWLEIMGDESSCVRACRASTGAAASSTTR
jgi:protoporphyrinogen oxidase